MKKQRKNLPLPLAACCVAAIALGSVAPVWAESPVLTIEGARIRGNQELPTVLYLVPWQAPVSPALDEAAPAFTYDAAIQPLERPQFQRLMRYHQLFQLQQSAAYPLAGEKAPKASP